jgi:hypothetical protein
MSLCRCPYSAPWPYLPVFRVCSDAVPTILMTLYQTVFQVGPNMCLVCLLSFSIEAQCVCVCALFCHCSGLLRAMSTVFQTMTELPENLKLIPTANLS